MRETPGDGEGDVSQKMRAILGRWLVTAQDRRRDYRQSGLTTRLLVATAFLGDSMTESSGSGDAQPFRRPRDPDSFETFFKITKRKK